MHENQGDWRQRPLFDQNSFERLDAQTGGAAAVIAATFLRLLPERRSALIAALGSLDQAEVGRLAHLCKSGASSVGLQRLAAYCAAIEQSPLGQIDALEAQAQFDQAESQLTALLAR